MSRRTRFDDIPFGVESDRDAANAGDLQAIEYMSRLGPSHERDMWLSIYYGELAELGYITTEDDTAAQRGAW